MSVSFYHTRHTPRPVQAAFLAALSGGVLFLFSAGCGAQLLIKGNLSGSAASIFGLSALCLGCFFTSWLSVRLAHRLVLVYAAMWAAMYFFIPLGIGWLFGQTLPQVFPMLRGASLFLSSLFGALLGMLCTSRRKRVI